MKYKITINRFKISNNNLTLFLNGEISDKRITPNFLSKPKLIAYFKNNEEDRRIPLFLSDIKFEKGKCYFKAKYTYKLNYIFFTSRNKLHPFTLSFNLQFIEYYKEFININIKKDNNKSDNFRYSYKILNNSIKLFPKKRKVFDTITKIINIIIRLFRCILGLLLLPIFFIEGLLRFYKKYPFHYKDDKLSNATKYRRSIINRYYIVSSVEISKYTLSKIIFIILFKLNKHLKVEKNKIYFISARRNSLSGNMEFIYNKIKDDKSLNINLLFTTKPFTSFTLKELNNLSKICATSKLIIIDEYTPILYYINFKKETKILQLWHACGAYKACGFSRTSTNQRSREHRCYDYLIVSAKTCKKWQAEAFGLSTDKIFATGIPRTDIFFDKKYKEKVKKEFFNKYPNFKNKKIILFAPTFRGKKREISYYPFEKFDIKKVCDSTPDDYVFIIKHHPFIKETHPIPKEYKNRVIDLSDNTEINDLLFVVDSIITDYSSLIFEASLLNIPMLFYMFDLEEYLKERESYFDIPHFIPGKIVKNLDEVISSINKNDYYEERMKEFCDINFDHKDGKSTDRVVKLIYKILKTS